MTQQIALITGASRGLGAGLAEELAARGYHVVAVGRTVGALEELDERVKAAGSPGALTLAPMDVTTDEAMQHLCASLFGRWGKVDLWLHTAVHAAPLSPAGHVDAKDFDKSLATNLRATARLIPMVEPLLRASPAGQAVFLRDARAGQPFFGAYGATKAAQIALAESWAAETAKTGPSVRILDPEPMATATRARFFPGEDRSLLSPPRAEATRLIRLLLDENL